MIQMMEKLASRKFLISAAAFLASLGTGIVGLANGNETVAIVGGVCTVLSSAIYSACEAYVDGKSAGANQTMETKTETKTVSATSTDRETVKQAIAPEKAEVAPEA